MVSASLSVNPVVVPLRWSECPVCATRRNRVHVEFPELVFVECSGCGTVYKSFEQPAVRPADFYERSYFHGRKSGRDRRFEHRVAKAQRELRAALEHIRPERLLDLGCSFGYVIEAGRRLGIDSAGMDISQYAVDVCRQRGYRAEAGSIEKLPFADGEFDVVMMKHVLEHTPDPRRALSEVRRVLSPAGVIVVAVPDRAYWKGDRRRRTYRYYRPDDLGQQHYVYYTRASLRQLLESAGFTVRADTKAAFRRRSFRSGPWGAVAETARFGITWLGQAVAEPLKLRRELFFVAQRRAD